MNRPYRKRRGPAGPNKNEEKVLRARRAAQAERFAVSVGSQFPSVKKIDLLVRILSPQGQTLEEDRKSMAAGDPLALSYSCLGRCGHGTFSLTRPIEQAVQAGDAHAEGNLACAESLYAGSAERCGCMINYSVDIAYKPLPAENPA